MKKLAFIALSSIIFYSCDKDDPPKGCTTDMASIAGPYKITAVSYKQTPTSAAQDYMLILFPDACDRDNVYTFNANGSYQIADVGQVCSPSGNDTGTWSLTGTSNLQIDGDPTILESFDCKVWVVSNTDVDIAGDKLTITLTKQ